MGGAGSGRASAYNGLSFGRDQCNDASFSPLRSPLLPLTAARRAPAQAPVPGAREFYLLRRYQLKSGPELKLTENYFAAALIPALGRMGLGPAGAFKLDIGPETPAYYLLIPGAVRGDAGRVGPAAGARCGVSRRGRALLECDGRSARVRARGVVAAGRLRGLAAGDAAGFAKGKRMFQLRTYESPSNGEHVRKVEMFHSGEFEIFKAAGFHPVFFGDTLVGSRMPSLTYMLTFADTAELEAKWNVFRNDPAWKKLSADPRFAFDPIVMNISNLMLSPLDCSQI